jgi:hypothetical protein
MNEDVFNAVVARNAARAMRLPDIPASSVASTTGTTPFDVPAASGTTLVSQNLGALVLAGWLSHSNALARLHSRPDVFLASGTDVAVPEEIYSRVQQYVERCSVQLADLHYGEQISPYYNSSDRCLFLGDRGKPLVDAVSVFAAENTDWLIDSEWRNAPVAFNCVELVEERDVRAQRLFAELQNGATHGRASVQRLRELEEVANEEGEPFSLDALDGLVMFANAHPNMPVPELTLSGTGAIVAEWRRPTLSVTLYFTNPISVQYLVKRRNPLHRELVERSSGATTVDRVGDTLKNLLSPSEWPIIA